jgi:hypothetical protein
MLAGPRLVHEEVVCVARTGASRVVWRLNEVICWTRGNASSIFYQVGGRTRIKAFIVDHLRFFRLFALLDLYKLTMFSISFDFADCLLNWVFCSFILVDAFWKSHASLVSSIQEVGLRTRCSALFDGRMPRYVDKLRVWPWTRCDALRFRSLRSQRIHQTAVDTSYPISINEFSCG